MKTLKCHWTSVSRFHWTDHSVSCSSWIRCQTGASERVIYDNLRDEYFYPTGRIGNNRVNVSVYQLSCTQHIHWIPRIFAALIHSESVKVCLKLNLQWNFKKINAYSNSNKFSTRSKFKKKKNNGAHTNKTGNEGRKKRNKILEFNSNENACQM